MIKINKKGVSLPELIAYTALISIISIMVISMFNFGMWNYNRTYRANQIYNELLDYNLNINKELSYIDISNVSDCGTTGTVKACILFTGTGNEDLYLEIIKVNNYNKLYLNGILYTSDNTYLTDNSYTYIDDIESNTECQSICNNAVVTIYFELSYVSADTTKNYFYSINI